MAQPEIVDRETWLAARTELLAEEKALTRQRERVAQHRRELPWVRVDDDYVFATMDGPATLADLFDGRPQLVVYHFMMGPEWDAGCPSCSFWADSYDGVESHLAARHTSMVIVSRTSLERIEAYRERMGWSFRWVSSLGNDFNVDFGVSFPDGGFEGASYNFTPIDEPPEELPGLSVFARNDAGEVFHTYSTYARGLDPFNATYQILDFTPKGRDEDGLPWTMDWVRRHDEY